MVKGDLRIFRESAANATRLLAIVLCAAISGTPLARAEKSANTASWTGSVSSMKLVAPNVGWATSMGRLMWTSDGGTDWKDITPTGPEAAAISAVFFLDGNHGWVLFAHGEPDVPGGLRFDLASTDNAGAAWSEEPVKMPDWVSESLFNGGGWLSFADESHGWLALGTGQSFISQGAGALLATSDGGRTWELTPGRDFTPEADYLAGPIAMVTPQFGWLVGGGASEELYVTRDGAKTWHIVKLEAPVKTDLMRKYDANFEQLKRSFQGLPPLAAKREMEWEQEQEHSYAAYDLPTFEDPRRGYICVTYPGVAVLFATEDGGVTWKPDRMLAGLHQASQGSSVRSVVVDSTWITGRVPKQGMPHLMKLGRGASATDPTMPAPEESGISQMSFTTPSQGWVLTVYGKLLSTKDGGATWTDITPGLKPNGGGANSSVIRQSMGGAAALAP